ncbi:glycosyltransferase family 8 protein [Cylindrospermum sp. FACHB-282]|uniref:glycosyltransferase family 8 protein n=1 Tax=Cylindrospermum sp. FACHB-282 TaxID=2692794 RepID=UPI00168204AC|nr:glycosyltransferase family 8 protein [Cylindrospermum sp. FACHB-282]MBD2383962.1 glycosyltransferase family 8 protein [Cylindrospermum sp. FACHB-282]
MEVLFCFDEKYEPHFGVAVTSLILNNIDHLSKVHIVIKKNSHSFNQKIDQLKEKANVEFLIYEIDDQQIKDLKLSYHVSTASYYRLLAPDILPDYLNKVLYLDSDLVVNGSIWELYNYDISNYVVAAYCGQGKAVSSKQRLGLNGDYYFNAGVILINLEAWRNINVGKKCIDFLRNYPEMAILLDQDALNKVIDGQVLHLDKKWNSLVELYTSTSNVNEQSVIIHFIGSLKPWHSWCISNDKEIYWSYLKKSPWSNYRAEMPNSLKKVLSAIKSIFKQLQNPKMSS